MPDLWMPGAEVHDIGNHAPCDRQYPAKAIAHITWDKNATADASQPWVPFDDLVTYFTGDGAGMAPHLIWDPFSGRIAQLLPADSRSMSLVSGSTRKNRNGTVVLQIEAVFFPYCEYEGKTYARLVDTPCKGWDRINAWTRSWGVVDNWPMGHPTDFTPNRDEGTWESAGGWYGHSEVPENDHVDPGSWPDFVEATVPTPISQPQEPSIARYETTINGLNYGYGAHGDQVTTVGRALVAHGFGAHYKVGPGPDWSDADTENYADYQKSLGYTGKDADGVPGVASLQRLLGYLPSAVPSFPGHQYFAPGQSNEYVQMLGERLVAKGFGSHYKVGPSPSWSEADRENVQDFQKAQGWTAASADGYPGPETWRRLFS